MYFVSKEHLAASFLHNHETNCWNYFLFLMTSIKNRADPSRSYIVFTLEKTTKNINILSPVKQLPRLFQEHLFCSI